MLRNRLRKIRALAERGVGGERETAARLLQDFREKYGIVEDEKSDTRLYPLPPKRGWRFKLMVQLIAWLECSPHTKSNPTQFQMFAKGHGGRRKLYLECTATQWEDFNNRFSVLCTDYEQLQRRWYRAFLKANSLLLPDDGKPMRRDQLEDARAASRMAKDITPSVFRQQLGDGGKES